MTHVIRYKTSVKTHRGKISLVFLGDIHRASRNCDVALLKRVYRWITRHDCLIVGMGDYSEFIAPQDRRYDVNSYIPDLITPDAQFKCLREEFEPFKDKIICLLDGNHDYGFYQAHHHNYVDALAYDLGTEYGTFDAVIRLEVSRQKGAGKRLIDIYAHHGWTGSRRTGGKVNKIEDLALIFPTMHLYAMGHVHLLGESPPRVMLTANKADHIVESTQRFVFTGSYLRGYVDHPTKPFSGYVARRAYPPLSLGSPLIQIQPFRNAGLAGHDKLRVEVKEVPT